MVAAGARRFEDLQGTLHRDVEVLRSRYDGIRKSAHDVPGKVADEIRALRRIGRDLRASARRHVRALPREYRVLGRLELRALRVRLDELFAGLDALPEGA
jgi:hypothetical protein